MPLRIASLLVSFALVVPLEAVADADIGREIAANCTTCHGTDAKSAVPSLVGLDRAAIVARMKEFRDGTRPSTIMQQLAKGYSDAEIEAAAAYLVAPKAD